MKHPLVSIVGTTATGKTDVAFALAEAVIISGKYPKVHIISADSRQVYRALPILSGADVPKDFVQKTAEFLYPFFTNQDETILLHGIGMLDIKDEWSVAVFREFALEIMKYAYEQNHFIIVVGGAGLYHRHILQTDPELNVAPNVEWRGEAADLSVSELQSILLHQAPERLESMNNSDRNNSRRLQRAIEVARADVQPLPEWQFSVIAQTQHVIYGLSVSEAALAERIFDRIDKRLDEGVLNEVRALMSTIAGKDMQISSTLGLSQLIEHIRGRLSLAETIEQWSIAELQYAKRQLVWWKNQTAVQWLEHPVEGVAILESITK